ncbi:MAG: GlcNAc-PI de-N-acetylase [Actinobacteria bacterium]|nr:GlcNAc-PI de-N-acetylase [Actinomycetota bacterium]
MATAVFFHAHPDDEAIATGGTMVIGARRGHRIVLVCATDGAVGEAHPDMIPEGETLADVRARELAAAADELSVSRLEFLGYRDSGMENTPTNDDPDCFWQADVEEAAERLARILREEQADIVTIYDPIGGYNHPDHIQVHRVGRRAAELAGTPHVFESTMNREQMKSFGDLGTPAADITHAVDVTGVVAEKKAAMAAHASQNNEDSIFLSLPDDAFAMAFGQEWYVHYGSSQQGAPYLDDIYAVLD